ncbi:hypothetical protein [Gaoshiqia sediminis]|uniref:Uncharacterized protein n=1 Tax=Gaoshiqia sediminis TaxID=2986998 RepID=A0AA42C6N1_9BACT|nr:hypothetical protein [Gaoshiqia sediminis]MCW0482704.1 hypothetical protein [Gaoshiqia sediminis]
MKKIVRLLLFLLIACHLSSGGMLPTASRVPVLQESVEPFIGNKEVATIQSPGKFPLYLYQNENTVAETITGSFRFHTITLPAGQVVPRNFSFRNDIRLTFYVIDQEAPVPVFIRGHALLC